MEAVHPGVDAHKKELKKSGKELTKEEKEPPTLHSDSHCGANPCGGWKPEGKERFWEVEKMIREARTKPTTPEFEEQARLAIVKALEEAKKKPVPEEESAIESDDDLEDDGVGDPQLLGCESCDSAAEMDRLLKSKWVPKKEEADPKATEEDQQKKVAAASDQNGVASSSKAAAAASSNSNNKEENKEDQPPKPPQQQEVAPPPKPQEQQVAAQQEEKKEEEAEGAEGSGKEPKEKKAKTPLAPRKQLPRGAKK